MALLFLDIEVFEKCFSLILRFLQHCWRGSNSSSRYLLAGSMLKDTANESRYDGSRWYSNSSSRYVLAGEIPRRYDGSRRYDDNLVILLRVSG
ncbi:hypothetical protein [Wolbachia endosymbiont (group A) of Rhinocyllus conicus]|uniref:hypothetical protein n=1 Tax=Wolbachia endosymbiont (group A) of Rhinocyllus conicus TaxID=2954053 RepID=UPI0022270557|nr:hypothetical protein [Wolbachia endosymbiont (group A) of Rhinocyllus conicus]